MISLICNKIYKDELNNINTHKSRAIQWLPCEIKFSVFANCKTLYGIEMENAIATAVIKRSCCIVGVKMILHDSDA